MKTIRNSILFTVVILAAAFSGLAQSAAEAPDFSAEDISGRTITLSDFRGKIVLLDFWATWCPPCRVEVPFLLDIFRKFKNRGFVLISVSLDRDLEAARRFVKEKQMDWLHIIDRDAGRALSELYQVEYIPSTFLVNRQGKIVARQLRGEELKDKIATLLK